MEIKLIEDSVQKVRSVMAVKLNVDEDESIQEIHVLSDNTRNPKQIIRDIEAILMVKFSIKVDHKKISIAQIEDGLVDVKSNNKSSRLKLLSVEYNNNGDQGTIKVIMQKDDIEYDGSLTGINTRNNLKRLVGNAVLKATEDYYQENNIFNLEDVKIVSMTGVEIAIVLVSSISKGHELMFAGSAIVNYDTNEAIARATLDAVNRYIERC